MHEWHDGNIEKVLTKKSIPFSELIDPVHPIHSNEHYVNSTEHNIYYEII